MGVPNRYRPYMPLNPSNRGKTTLTCKYDQYTHVFKGYTSISCFVVELIPGISVFCLVARFSNSHNMKTKQIIIILLALTTISCGSFNHQQETYYVNETSQKFEDRVQPRLLAQIVPSTENSSIPFLYQSRKWGAPYSLRLSANSTRTVCTFFSLHSFKVKLESNIISEKNFVTPLKLDLCGSKIGDQNNYPLYSYNLGSSLEFEEGKRIDLEVTYSQANAPEKITILMSGKGEQEKSKSSLWNAYMGI